MISKTVFKKELTVKRNGPNIVSGYLRLLREAEKEGGGFQEDLKGTDWKIVHQRGFGEFFIEGSLYSFEGLTVKEAEKEMEKYVGRKAKHGDAISLKGAEDYSNFPGFTLYSLKRLTAFESENEEIEFSLPELRSPFNYTDLRNPAKNLSISDYLMRNGVKNTLVDLKEYFSNKCDISVKHIKTK